MLAGRSADKLEALGRELDAPWCVADATDAAAVDAAVAETVARHGRISGAANCVGSLLLKPAHATRDDELFTTLATHVHSSFFLLRACARAMPQGGSLVFVSSAAARIGLANHEAIAAAKGAIEGMALSAAATYAARGLRINVVAPGLVRAGMTERIFASAPSLAASVALHPLGRTGEPIDVARAIAFLLDEHSGFITGQVLGVDGGLATLKTRGAA